MATFFGEVVQQTSRAFWDGYEEIDEDQTDDAEPVFKLDIIGKSDNDSYDNFIIAADCVCSEFVSVFLTPDNSKHIVTIEKVRKNIDDSKKRQYISSAEIHELNKSVLLLKCVTDIDIVEANELLNLITPWLNKSVEIVVLASKPVEEYRCFNTQNLATSPCCRALRTEQYKSDIPCPLLKCPNSYAGFAAAVLSWCQVKDKRCVLYIYYYSNLVPLSNGINVEPLLELCKKLPWYNQLELKSTGVKIIKSIPVSNRAIANSNLYL